MLSGSLMWSYLLAHAGDTWNAIGELLAVVIHQLHQFLVVRAMLRQGRIADLLHQPFLFGEMV